MRLTQLSSRRDIDPEGGFTMLVTLGVLAICALLSAAAFGTVVNDIPLRKQSREKKQAYAAAEAGINFYLSRLNQDNEYWAKCTNLSPPNASEPSPVTQPWTGSDVSRPYRNVPGESAKYTVELLPANGATACNSANASATMIDAAAGTLRIRATGVVGQTRRSIILSLRRKGFLDYLYFTDYETTDPVFYGAEADLANTRCVKRRPDRTSYCREIQFTSTDKINGPFHTNDDILTCNGATFGRTPADRIEASGPGKDNKGWTNKCGSTPPNFKAAWQVGVDKLPVPTSNLKVTNAAFNPNILTGTTNIVLNGGSTMTITPEGEASYTQAMPSNGVLWVKNGAGCGSGLSPEFQDYSEPAGCANVSVSGTYAKSLTIVSDKDIIVDGDLRRASSDNLLGLIATNFVRVYHPVTRTYDSRGNQTNCVNATGTMQNVRIDAAILAREHSFTVDNYSCGSAQQILTVDGAIAQKFRGPVGTGNGSVASTGYVKDYGYDDRLRFRNPPNFLDPVSAAWRPLRQNEQVPAS